MDTELEVVLLGRRDVRNGLLEYRLHLGKCDIPSGDEDTRIVHEVRLVAGILQNV